MANYFLNDDGSITKKNKKKKGNNYILQDDGTITLNQSNDNDIAPVKTKISSIDELKAREKELDSQLVQLQKTGKKNEWWSDDRNFFENVGNVAYKLFAEQDSLVGEDLKKKKELEKERAKVQDQIKNYQVANTKLDTIDKLAYTISGGIKSGMEGIGSTIRKGTAAILGQDISGVVVPESYEEKLSKKARQETDGVAGFGLDVVGGISRQLPNMLSGNTTVNTILAAANFGGGAYNEAKRMGVSEERATTYGITVAGLETLLNKILPSYNIGGKNVFGKTATDGLFNNIMGKVTSNVFLRNTLTSGAGEFTEEYLQEFLDPIIREAILEEDNKVGILGSNNLGDIAKNLAEYTAKNFFSKENAYAGLLGFVTSGVMGAQSNIDAYRYEKATGRSSETGLTASEQAMIDSEVAKRTEGKNLTKKQKAKVESDVIEAFEKGELSTNQEEIIPIQQNEQQANTNLTVEEIDNQIVALEEQLSKTEDDAEYERISNQIRVLEEQANQLEQQEIAPVQQNIQNNNLDNQLNQEYNGNGDVNERFQRQGIEGNSNQNVENERGRVGEVLRDNGVLPTSNDSGTWGVPETRTFDNELGTTEERRQYLEYAKNNLVEVNNEEVNNLKKVANELGLNLKTYNGSPDASMLGTIEGNDVYLDANDYGENHSITDVFYHELLHNAKNNKSLYNSTEIRNLIKDFSEMPEAKGSIEKFLQSKGLEPFFNTQKSKMLIEEILADYTAKHLSKYNVDYSIPQEIEYRLNRVVDDSINEMKLNKKNSTKSESITPSQETDIAPIKQELSVLTSELKDTIKNTKKELKSLKTELKAVRNDVSDTLEEFKALTEADIPMVEQQNDENFRNIDETNAPIETEDTTPEIEDEITATRSLEDVRDFDEVGNRKVKAYQYENPEVRPYFQEMARYMLGDLENSVKGERNFNDQLYYDTAGDQGFYGTTRQTTDDIAELLDSKYNYTYKDIRKGLEAIIEDHGAENIAVAKRIEFALDKRLREGYTDVYGYEIPANEDYIKLLQEKEIVDYYSNIPIDESLAPIEEVVEEDIAPVANTPTTPTEEKVIPLKEQLKENSVVKEKPTKVEQEVAQILDEKPTPKNKDRKLKAIATINVVDKGYYISKLARQKDNRQLDALWDNTLLSNAQAQEVIGEGRFKFNQDTKTYDKVGDSVYEIFEGLETTDKVKDFNEYMYHKLNIERMSLEDKAKLRMKTLRNTTLKGYTIEDINEMAKTKLREDAKQEIADLVNAAKEYKGLTKVKNKPVFGSTVDANTSIEIVNKIEQNNPEFSDYAKKVYNYESGTHSDLSLLVESGILSQEDADYYKNKYESYVPIIRDMEAEMMEKQMFGKRASVGNTVKSATGGSQNIIPLKDAMAIKTMLVQRSANMNKLGLELMRTLNPVVESETVSAENIIEDISNNKDLIQAGTNGKAPTMTVYENGVKKTFEIPVEIYEALKPNYDSITKATIKPLNAYSNFKRGVLTQYSPLFIVRNGIKDIQDVLLNSQHPVATYKKMPEAIAQLKTKGYWYKEMQSQGLFQDTYYDNQGGFDTTKKGLSKITEFYPLKKISDANDFIERIPRIAEYIASREAGKSIEEASLDASRVTTNFKAGGEWTKFLNRNGATFLNASVQGATQQVRNIQEAHQKGLQGYMNLATRYTLAALPAVLLNSLLWDDDDEYEELSDYIKDNYYIIGKYGDGQFIRIPKGRMTAVIQKTLEEMQNLITGDEEVDLGNYLELVANNIAPSNPIENNIFSPFINTKLFNKNDPGKTWYGEDLVPLRLQSKPAAEQYDESTDEFSKWLGEKLNLSPIKINNLIDQNTGFIGDFLLPMMTTEAKTKNDNPIVAGIEDSFTADVVFDNKYSTDFYSVKEELAKKSNSYNATDEDVLKTKYMNSMQAQMNDIYAEIRDVQNSNMDKKSKYAKVRDLRKQLNDIAETSLNNYNKVNIESNYAKVGEIEFRKNKSGEWEKITSKQLEKQNEAVNNYGVSANNYWASKEEYDYAIEYPDKYKVISQIDTYDNYIKYKDDIAAIKEQYVGYSTEQRKAAIQQYIQSLSLSVPQKIMLEKMAGGYSIKSYENYMFQYIESLPMTAAEKQALHKQLFD